MALPFIAIQFIGHAVGKSLPAGFDNIVRNPHGHPCAPHIGAFNQHSDDTCRAPVSGGDFFIFRAEQIMVPICFFLPDSKHTHFEVT